MVCVYEAKHKGKLYPWVKVQWLWRPETLETPEKFVAHPRELFIGELEDNNPYQAIEMLLSPAHARPPASPCVTREPCLQDADDTADPHAV